MFTTYRVGLKNYVIHRYFGQESLVTVVATL